MTCTCGRPTSGAFLCTDCVRTMRRALDDLGFYLVDLRTLRERRTRIGDGPKVAISRDERPIGMDLRFAAVVTETAPDGRTITIEGRGTEIDHQGRRSLATWTQRALRTWPDLPVPPDTVRSMSRMLSGVATAIAGQEWAPTMLADVTGLTGRLERFVDLPPARWYAGVCLAPLLDDEGNERHCDRQLYATTEEVYVRCPGCGAEFHVDDRRAVLLEEAWECLASVRTIARIVTTFGGVALPEVRVESRINTWVWRKQLTAYGTRVISGRPARVYRVGDVLGLFEINEKGKPA